MVDFAKEQVIPVSRLAKRLDVSKDTIRRWFDEGLEKAKIGSKVFTSLEALNRFAGLTESNVSADAELAEQNAIADRRGL